MGIKLFCVVFIFFGLVVPVNAAILVESRGRKVSQSYQKIASNAYEFRKKRKVGVGVGMAGVHGLLGINFELNFTPETSLITGFGISRGFREYHFAVKRALGGKRFLPYLSAGLTNWSSSLGDSLNESSPGFFVKRFLSNKEKQSGNFSETIIYPGLGVQYLVLDGEWAGTTFYAELLMMIDIDDFLAEPNGGIGMMYYF